MAYNEFTNIGFIGTGKMAEAIIAGIQKHSPQCRLMGMEKSPERADYIRQNYHLEFPDRQGLLQQSEVLFLCTKPQNLSEVMEDLRELWPDNPDQVVVSILAGVSTSKIQELLPWSKALVRVMPNTPALIGQGMAGVSFADAQAESYQDAILQLLRGLGETLVVQEKLMNAVTGVSGSGPAYVYTFIQALADGGIQAGLSRDQALKLATETVMGAAALVKDSDREPYALRGDVSSPGGTTINALKVLDESGFSGIVMNAVAAAQKRAEELGG